jgi:hypothetical protein
MGYKVSRALVKAVRTRFGTLNFGTFTESNTWLVLEIVTVKASARLWVLPVVGHPLQYDFRSDSDAHVPMGIHLVRHCLPQRVHFGWPQGAGLIHRVTGQELPLPSALSLVTFTPGRLASLLQADYTYGLYLYYQGYNYPLRMRPMDQHVVL